MRAHIKAEKETVTMSSITRKSDLFWTIWEKFHFLQAKFFKKFWKSWSRRYSDHNIFLEEDNRAMEQVPESSEKDGSNEPYSDAFWWLRPNVRSLDIQALLTWWHHHFSLWKVWPKKSSFLSLYQKSENVRRFQKGSRVFCEIFSPIGDIEIFAHENGRVVSPGIPVV